MECVCNVPLASSNASSHHRLTQWHQQVTTRKPTGSQALQTTSVLYWVFEKMKEKRKTSELVVAPAMAATTIRSSTALVTPTTTTAAAIATPAAIRAAAPVHAIATARAAVITVVKNAICTLTFRHLISDVLQAHSALLKFRAAPFDLPRQIGQFRGPKALTQTFGHQRRPIFGRDLGFLQNGETLRPGGQRFLRHFRPSPLRSPRKLTHLLSRRPSAQGLGHPLKRPLTIALR